MHNIAYKTAFGLIFVMALVVFGTMIYNETHQSRLCCFKNTSEKRDVLRSALDDMARKNHLAIYDRSYEVTSELDKLGQPRPAKVLHGDMRRGNETVLSYSNIGLNGTIFHVSFHVEYF